MAVEPREPLAPEDASRLMEFARACKAAARVVVLYPGGHPAITATLGRLEQLTSPASLPLPLRISVVADALLIDGRAPARHDPAVGELAAILHSHLIGELTVNPGGDAEAWRRFLLLLSRAPDAVRAEGGITRLWTTMAGRHVEIREIDYSEVLREREAGRAAVWEEVIANCLQGDAFNNEEAIRALLEIVGDSDRVAELVAALDTRAAETGRGIGSRTSALVRLLEGIIQAVADRQPEQLEAVLGNLAHAIGQLSPEMLLALVSQAKQEPAAPAAGAGGAASSALSSVLGRMSDDTIVNFVSRNAMTTDGSIERVAHVFQTLVPQTDDRERLLHLARDQVANSPLGNAEGFEQQWESVAQKMITSYSDRPFVSEAYARELTSARTKAVSVEELSDDPPERLTAWLSTVATTELRHLDLLLVMDLLRIEQSTERWTSLLRPVVAFVEDLMLVGDFDGASQIVGAIVHETRREAARDRRQAALIAVDVLVAGPMMRHIVTHLLTIDDAQFAKVKAMCVSLGEVLIRPLAEALTTEERTRPRERLTAIMIAFGASGRREVERLKNSPNAAVRRTAIYLLREFGGTEALPELTELLNDNEQQVQREAVRAILRIGTDKAYQILEKALADGSTQSREAIMQSLTSVRDERATPLFTYILGHVDHRGKLSSIYLRAVEALGALKDPEGVPPLKDALYRREWWAPWRTAALRTAAAQSLARIGTPEAMAVLEEAAHAGPRGLRATARAHLSGRRRSERSEQARGGTRE